MKKYFLTDLIEEFDTCELSGAWSQDQEGEWFTTDSEEANWFIELAEAYIYAEDNDIDISQVDDYELIIDMAKKVA